MVEYELKRYGSALSYLGQALTATAKPLDRDQRVEVERLRSQARGYVASVRVTVTPPSAQWLLDGEHVDASSGTLVLDVGDHVLEARADGYHAARQSLTVVGRDDRTVVLDLVATAVTVATAGAASGGAATPQSAQGSAADAGSEPVYAKWWVWTVAGAVVTAVAVGTALAIGGDKRLGDAPGTNLEPIGDVQLLRGNGR